jgi:hypothetical protein
MFKTRDYLETVIIPTVVIAVVLLLIFAVRQRQEAPPDPTPTHQHVMCFDVDHRTASGPVSLCVEGVLAETGFAMTWYVEDNDMDWLIAPVSAGG